MALKDKLADTANGTIYRFSPTVCDWTTEDPAETKKVLGGKGASLVSMIQAGLPVPPGFTITTSVCNEYLKAEAGSPQGILLDKLMHKVMCQMEWLGKEFGFVPLVSVRSGAPISMPGMMDTILNVGLTKESLPEWIERIGERAALDSYRRLIQMLGATAYDVPKEAFDKALSCHKSWAKAEHDSELSPKELRELIENYEEIFLESTGMGFPQTVYDQLLAAVSAVFDSWMNPRAIEYRKLNGISADMGTAVTVQAMVFGNLNDNSGSGVLFTRDPSTGMNAIMGEYLVNAQGEDVVSGVRTPEPLDKYIHTGTWATDHLVGAEPWAAELIDVCGKLEGFYRDMVDVEFTVMNGKLWILQSRTGKRSAAAAFKIAVDMVTEGMIVPDEALDRISPAQFNVMKRPSIAPGFDVGANMIGLPACPGVVTGKPVFSSQAAIDCKEPCILITHETTPDDIGGMNAAVGILTKTGGATSHAAVVARAMDKTCVTGCTDLDLGHEALWADVKTVTICGSTGRVWLNVDVPVVDASGSWYLQQVAAWCAEGERLSTPAFDEEWPQLEQVIHAAEWWGQPEMMDAVLHDIATQPHEVFLDIRRPSEFRPGDDALLEDAFEPSDPYFDEFDFVLREQLLVRSNELAPHVTLVVREAEDFTKSPLSEHYAREHAEGPTGAPLDHIVLRRLAA